MAFKEFVQDTSNTQRAQHKVLTHIRRELSALALQHSEHVAATTQALTALKQELEALVLGEQQLRAVVCADADLTDALPELDTILSDPQAIDMHIRSSINRAVRHDLPFPYMIVDDALPAGVFDALVKGLPPTVLFADRPVNHQHLKPPFEFAPRYSRRIWTFMVDVIIKEFIQPAVLEKFEEPVNAWFRENFPGLGDEPLRAVQMTCSDGRLLLRRRGYRIPPHRDPKWAVVTCLLYLPRAGDDDRWGTQLYTVADDEEAQGAKPHWIADARCTLVEDVPFRPNRLLVFVNSVGAHGAHIPEDAEPAGLERYAYQFRIGPNGKSIADLMAKLPEDRKALWAGKAAADY